MNFGALLLQLSFVIIMYVGHNNNYGSLMVNLSLVFWGGREGYQSLLNTDVRRELDHMGQFFKMAADYKKKIGFTGQLLIEPKPKEPMKHQYDYGQWKIYNSYIIIVHLPFLELILLASV